MEKDRRVNAPGSPPACLLPTAILLIAATVGPAGCGLLTASQPEPDDEEPPDIGDRPLRVDGIVPATDTLSTRPTLYVRFNDYLEDDSFRVYDTGSLDAGALGWGGWANYVMTDKTLVWTARSSVPAQLEVTFGLSSDITSVLGSSLREADELITYRTADRGPIPNPNPLPSADWSHVRAIFEDQCTDCHGADGWQLNPLTRESLVGEPSEQVDRLLVRAYDPADSYLMHKLLWDYPLRRFSPQPPPWAGGEELPREDLIKIEQWIAAGAPGPDD